MWLRHLIKLLNNGMTMPKHQVAYLSAEMDIAHSLVISTGVIASDLPLVLLLDKLVLLLRKCLAMSLFLEVIVTVSNNDVCLVLNLNLNIPTSA